MSNKPFPFSVCKECCSSGEGGETVIVNEGGYKYCVYTSSKIIESYSLLPVDCNTMTYIEASDDVFGADPLVINVQSPSTDASQEACIIIDLSNVTVDAPAITINGNTTDMKWLGGEPPEMIAGKCYLISVITVSKFDSVAGADYITFNLCVGGEFA